jgi:hypothetical protein
MRLAALSLLVGLLAMPRDAAGQIRLDVTAHGAHVAAEPEARAIGERARDDDPVVAARQLADALSERLRPISERLREDGRLRSAGAVVGLTAIALGSLRGGRALTFAGTQALRVGFERQIGTIREQTGFTLSPSIGRRSCALVITRTFP